MPKCSPLLTILDFNIFKIARYSSNIKICDCQCQRTFEPFIAKIYELIRLKFKITKLNIWTLQEQ